MTLQRIALSIVATVASLGLTPALKADTHVALAGFGATVVTPDAGIGFWIGGGAPSRHVYHRPVYRDHYYYGYPRWHGYVRVGPPVVVVRPPVIVPPAPPVVIEPAPPVIPSSTVIVWITNSNGSQTSVQLTRQGRGYLGPRGEYYDQMPTNEQLRVVYGF
ncbi:MAG: hypothetical protein M1376_02580 [Planctomycetes bacterium]|nr:hypothetical protein [Planctomycetota bacterium]